MLDLAILEGWTWILIEFIWMITFFLIVAVISLVIYVSRLRRKSTLEEVASKAFCNILEEKVVQYLFTSASDSGRRKQEIFRYLERVVKEKDQRGILVSIMIKMQRNISGELMVEIRELFVDLGLVSFAMEKLESSNWGEVLGGILQLTAMEVKGADEKVSALQQHPKAEIRSAAHLFEFRVFGYRGLESILSLENRISEWDQIQLLESIRYFEGSEIPDLYHMLSSENPSIVIFGLKLSRLFNLGASEPALYELLKSAHKEIRMEVQWLLAHLGEVEARKYMKADIDSKDVEEKVCLIRALELIIDQDDRPFLIGLLNDQSEEVRYYAQRALEKLNPQRPESDQSKVPDLRLGVML